MTERAQQTMYAEGFFNRLADILGPCLATVGISPRVMDDPSSQVAVSQFVEILEVAAKELEDDCLGLHIASLVETTDLGVFGYGLAHAPTVRRFLRTCVRYMAAYTDGVDTSLSVHGDRVTWSYQLTDPGIVARRQDSEWTLAFVNKVLQQEVNGEWRLLEVHFEHEKPGDISEHQRIFKAPVFFNKPVNAFFFRKALLENKIKEADPRLFPVLRSHLDSVLLKRTEEHDLVAHVSNIISASLSNQVLGLAQVAETLGIPSWTLQRRLRDKGVVFSQLVSDTRRRLAETYLKNADIPLMEVAFLLGYSEVSAFSRAFRNWKGKPPFEYRQELLSSVPTKDAK